VFFGLAFDATLTYIANPDSFFDSKTFQHLLPFSLSLAMLFILVTNYYIHQIQYDLGRVAASSYPETYFKFVTGFGRKDMTTVLPLTNGTSKPQAMAAATTDSTNSINTFTPAALRSTDAAYSPVDLRVPTQQEISVNKHQARNRRRGPPKSSTKIQGVAKKDLAKQT
jgi:hypothetical protein